MRYAILGLLVVVLMATGCGGPSTKPKETTVDYLGQPLHCLNFKGADHGSWSGVSCDFVRYWQDN